MKDRLLGALIGVIFVGVAILLIICMTLVLYLIMYYLGMVGTIITVLIVGAGFIGAVVGGCKNEC